MKKLLKKILFKIFPQVKFKRSGERQVSTKISNIRNDHVGRYKFASNYIKPRTNILDMACGVGYGSNLLAKQNSDVKVIGIDIEENAIAYAKKHYAHENVEFRIGNAEKPDLPDNYFDTVISFETLEHLPSTNSFITNVNRILRTDGLFIFSSPNEKTLPFDKEKFPFHQKHYTVEEVIQKLDENSFKLLDIFSQHDTNSEDVVNNDSGLFLIFVTQKNST